MHSREIIAPIAARRSEYAFTYKTCEGLGRAAFVLLLTKFDVRKIEGTSRDYISVKEIVNIAYYKMHSL